MHTYALRKEKISYNKIIVWILAFVSFLNFIDITQVMVIVWVMTNYKFNNKSRLFFNAKHKNTYTCAGLME